jgi:predicted ATPase/class 3 adenylate cyclase/DNA-binding CsgD family transcriptional regulator
MFATRCCPTLASMSEIDPRADTSLLNWSDLGVNGLPTGTVTLLLADVEGSTRLWQTQPEEMTAAVARLNRTVDDLVTARGGVRPVEQGEGDSFVAAFARASDAVGCALDLQRAPLAPIRLRIGVHTGQVQLRDEGNYAGPTINRTARLRDLAHGGQTVLSGAAEQLVFDWLPTDTWLTELGTHQLRDLPRPERVLQLCHPDLRNEFPPLRTAKAVDTRNLPAQLTSFIGRGPQMSDVRALLTDNRLVTLTGAGGAGKTRLAVEVSARCATDFRDGVRYVDLAPVTHPAVGPVAVAHALGLPDQPGLSTMETLIRFVGDRQMLIVLDNCEHLLDATASLATELLAVCPAVRLLTTSREPVNVPGEVTFPVPSLTLKDEAIELFVDRARRVRPDFAITEDTAATVTDICRRLDGMPLAIELAAARVRALSLDEILDSLHDRFRLLTGGARTAVRRQQTLRASVDWSHALLTDTERILFRRLAVFLGGFDLVAAQAVAGSSEVERYQVLDQLALLVDKSLVVAENISGPTRYRLLETVRQYALEKLGESGEADTVRTRHRDHYTSMAALLDAPPQTGHEQRVEQAEVDIDNLRSAFGWSLETGDPERALQLATSLQPLWLSRGHVQEGLAWLEAGLAPERPHAVAPAIRVRAYADKAFLLAAIALTGDVDEADEALTTARELDDPALVIRALVARASVSVYDAAVARPYFAEAARRAGELGNSWMLSQILSRQTGVEMMAGQPKAGWTAAAQGLRVAEEIGDGFTARVFRVSLAWAQAWQGDLTGALAELPQLISEATAHHDAMSRLYGLVVQGFAQIFMGDTGGGQTAADALRGGYAELTDDYETLSHSTAAAALLAEGDAAAAWRNYETARERAAGPVMTATMWLSALAPLACGDCTVARRWADEVVSATWGCYLSAALGTRARVAIAQDEFEQAERDAHQSLVIAAETGTGVGLFYTLECLADVAAHAGSHREGARLFGAAEGARQRTGEVRFKVLDAEYKASIAMLRDAMGDSDFEAAWAEGAVLSTEEAIAYAQRGRGERKRPPSGWASLTPAECDVVRLVGEGLANKDIATRLFISPRTVQTHLTHVYTKLGLTSRVQLVQEAARHPSAPPTARNQT